MLFRIRVVFILSLLFVSGLANGQSKNRWQDVLRDRKGVVHAWWYESRPFIYRTDDGDMRGIEPEIMEGFRKYIKDTHHVDVTIDWKEANSFDDVYNRVKAKQDGLTFGVSAFSITPLRQSEVDFGKPYMADISVLISSKNVPLVKNEEEFNGLFSRLKAITIKGTTYEQDLLNLKTRANLPFQIEYIPSSQNILHTIESQRDAFGYIDLPVYLMIFNDNPSVNVERQNLSPIKREGYAFIMPTGSDWSQPLAQYFASDYFKLRLEPIISRYINVELYRFVEGLSVQSNEPVILLAKEKEIQQRDILGKSEQIAQGSRRTKFLTAFAVVILTFLVIIVFLYRKRNEQKEQIEVQGRSLALKSEQLEKRNEHLMALDEEKNNVIKILAHDLRTPINHVQGLAQVFLLSNPGLPEDQKAIIQSITDASLRLNKMITHILDIDALENNRVKIFMDDVALNALVGQVVRSFDKQAAKKEIQLTFEDKTRKATIKGDSLFLIQIVENLLSNALKFSGRGKPVHVAVAESGDQVQISVTDSGPGLTEDDKQKLFKKFQRLTAQPTDGESSLGLGLSIVKKYTELMGGRVSCESRLGHGARFTVEFPKI